MDLHTAVKVWLGSAFSGDEYDANALKLCKPLGMKRTFHKMKRMNPILCKVLSIIALASLFLLLFPKKPAQLDITMEAGDGLDHPLPSSEHFIFLLASTFLLTAYLVSYRSRQSWMFSYVPNHFGKASLGQLFQMVAILRKRNHRYRGITCKTNFNSLRIDCFGFKHN